MELQIAIAYIDQLSSEELKRISQKVEQEILLHDKGTIASIYEGIGEIEIFVRVQNSENAKKEMEEMIKKLDSSFWDLVQDVKVSEYKFSRN